MEVVCVQVGSLANTVKRRADTILGERIAFMDVVAKMEGAATQKMDTVTVLLENMETAVNLIVHMVRLAKDAKKN